MQINNKNFALLLLHGGTELEANHTHRILWQKFACKAENFTYRHGAY